MRSIWRSGTCLLLAPLVTSCTGATAGNPRPASVESEVLSLTFELAESWSRLDPDDYLARFSDDLVFYVQGSRLSRTDFEAAIRQVMGAVIESTFEVVDPEVEVLGPNAAVASFQWTEATIDADGSTADQAGAITLVYERRDGEWLVIRAHESLGRTP